MSLMWGMAPVYGNKKESELDLWIKLISAEQAKLNNAFVIPYNDLLKMQNDAKKFSEYLQTQKAHTKNKKILEKYEKLLENCNALLKKIQTILSQSKSTTLKLKSQRDPDCKDKKINDSQNKFSALDSNSRKQIVEYLNINEKLVARRVCKLFRNEVDNSVVQEKYVRVGTNFLLLKQQSEKHLTVGGLINLISQSLGFFKSHIKPEKLDEKLKNYYKLTK